MEIKLTHRLKWIIFGAVHVCLLLGVLLFPVYQKAMDFLPDFFAGCSMHDLMHLYCPLCGGTRATAALLKLDILLALKENAYVVLIAVMAVIYDVVAFVRLLLKKGRVLPIPGWLWITLASILVVWILLRNVLMVFWGIDPVGDLAGYWAWLR